jgi:hypothetical protein
MADQSSNFAPTPTGNVIRSITLDIGSDDHTPANVPNGFHCDTAGNVTGRLLGDSVDTVRTLIAGAWYPYRWTVIRKTGTTAAGAFLYTV